MIIAQGLKTLRYLLQGFGGGRRSGPLTVHVDITRSDTSKVDRSTFAAVNLRRDTVVSNTVVREDV